MKRRQVAIRSNREIINDEPVEKRRKYLESESSAGGSGNFAVVYLCGLFAETSPRPQDFRRTRQTIVERSRGACLLTRDWHDLEP